MIMLRNTAVVSISLSPEILAILERLTRETAKTRSDVVRDLIVSYARDKSWEQIFAWGRQTKQKFKIKSEEDILKIIND